MRERKGEGEDDGKGEGEKEGGKREREREREQRGPFIPVRAALGNSVRSWGEAHHSTWPLINLLYDASFHLPWVVQGLGFLCHFRRL